MSGGDHRRHARVGELAGGTAAECAAVCCCCPLTALNVVALVVYKVPTGLCRRVVKNNRRKRDNKKALSNNKTFKKALLQDADSGFGFEDVAEISAVGVGTDGQDGFDAEVWDQFRGAGFWRSPSRRDS